MPRRQRERRQLSPGGLIIDRPPDGASQRRLRMGDNSRYFQEIQHVPEMQGKNRTGSGTDLLRCRSGLRQNLLHVRFLDSGSPWFFANVSTTGIFNPPNYGYQSFARFLNEPQNSFKKMPGKLSAKLVHSIPAPGRRTKRKESASCFGRGATDLI